MRRILNTQIIQKTISKLLRLSTYHCTVFAIWMDSTRDIFRWVSRFTTIMSQCKGTPWYQLYVKNSWNWNFSNFKDLVLILQEATTSGILQKKLFLKFLQYSQENACAGVLFLVATLSKERTHFLKNISGWLLLFY